MNKDEIRRRYRKIRKELGRKQERSSLILERLVQLPEYQKASVVGIYLALPEEVSLDAFFERILHDGKKAAVPVSGKDGIMEMVLLKDLSDVKKGPFGIREPLSDEAVIPDWIIVPGIAFDEEGYRTGFGGGYYDRYLAEHKIPCAGVCFEAQIVKEPLEHMPYDIPVDVLVSEKRTARFAVRQGSFF